MLPEPLFHNFSPMNSGIVILEYAFATREQKKIHWWNNLVIQYIQVVSLTDQLTQPQIITLTALTGWYRRH